MHFTDTHTHLYSNQFRADIDTLIEEARKAGVERFYLPNIDSESIERMLALEEKYPGVCVPMMGLHPCSVKEDWEKEMALVEEWLAKRKFCAVGEMGMDLYWDKTFLEQQKEVFRRQVKLANRYKLPIVIHTRESFDVTLALLDEVPKEAPQGIFHCFTGTAEQALEVIRRGFYIGIGGVVTFKKSGLDEVVAAIPLEHIVLETDAPYLAPAPYRGKRNLPVYVKLVAEKIAEIKSVPVEVVAEVTTRNAASVFGEPPLVPRIFNVSR